MRSSTYFRGFGALSAGLLMLNLGCESGSPDQDPAVGQETAGPQETAISQEGFEGRVLECEPDDDPDVSPGETTDYAVDFMTRQLWRYPSFAEYAGLTSVSSCEEALAYVRAYNKYSLDHPGFEKRPDPKASTAQSELGSSRLLPRLKTRNGKASNGPLDTPPNIKTNPSPVVGLVPVVWFASGKRLAVNMFCRAASGCTGIIIAKNWILTAGHCLQAAHLEMPPGMEEYLKDPVHQPKPICPPGGLPRKSGANIDFRGDARFTVQWAGFSTNQGSNYLSYYTKKAVTTYQFPYEGLKDGNVPTGRDLGLLYIYPTLPNEGALVADVTKGGAAWITRTALPDEGPPPTWPWYTSGFGVWWEYIQTTKEMKQHPWPSEAPLTVAPIDNVVPSEFEFGNMIADDTYSSALCHGDSGGPLYRSVQVAGEGQLNRLVVYGVNARLVPWDGSSGSACPKKGDRNRWMRVDREEIHKHKIITWIKESMAEFNEGPCEPKTIQDVGQNRGPVDVWQCWGKPCQEDKDCPQDGAGMVCRNSGTKLKEALVQCAPELCPKSDCACVVGRCVPKASQIDAGAK